MDYKLLAEQIGKAIEQRPGDVEAYRDLFSLCRDQEGTDFEAAHRLNKELRGKCAQQLRVVSPTEGEAFYEQWRRCLLFDAPHDFDSFMLYLELDRKPCKRFYAPRRHYLKPMVQGFQDVLDGKLRLLTISIHPDIHFLETEGIGGLEKMCDRLGLTLNRKKTRVVPIADYYKWLKTKFILTSTGAVVLKMNRESTAIIRRKYRSFKAKIENGSMTLADVRCSHNSYHGHMERGNSFKVLESTDHYFKSIFGFYPDKKGWSVHV